jgi:hypothetical protein
MTKNQQQNSPEKQIDDQVDALAALLRKNDDHLERSFLLCRAVHGLVGTTLDDPLTMLGVLETVKADLHADIMGHDDLDDDESD